MSGLQPLLNLSLAAGLLGLDATAAFQTMASRPLVAGAVAGWLLGDAPSGLALGAVLELCWIGALPVGSLVPPDGTAAAIFAPAVLGALKSQGLPWPAAAAIGILAGLLLAFSGGKAEVLQRRLADGVDRWVEARLLEGHEGSLSLGLLAGLALALGRGALVMALALSLVLPMIVSATGRLDAGLVEGFSICFWLLLMYGLAAAADHFWERRSLRYALGAALLAVALAYVTRAPAWILLGLLGLYALACGALRYRIETAPKATA